jgi:hypothetical protein
MADGLREAVGTTALTVFEYGHQVIIRDPHCVDVTAFLTGQFFPDRKIQRRITGMNSPAAVAATGVFGSDPAGVSAETVASCHQFYLQCTAGRRSRSGRPGFH